MIKVTSKNINKKSENLNQGQPLPGTGYTPKRHNILEIANWFEKELKSIKNLNLNGKIKYFEEMLKKTPRNDPRRKFLEQRIWDLKSQRHQ